MMQSKDPFERHVRLGVAATLALGCMGVLGYEAIANQAPDMFDASIGAVAMLSLRALDLGDIDIGAILGKKSA